MLNDGDDGAKQLIFGNQTIMRKPLALRDFTFFSHEMGFVLSILIIFFSRSNK